MKRVLLVVLAIIGFMFLFEIGSARAQSPTANRPASYRRYDAQDWNRFYYYPYVYYNQNFRPMSEYRSADSLYYRYSRPMQVPTYNPNWQNYYPVKRRFHEGTHFLLDIM